MELVRSVSTLAEVNSFFCVWCTLDSSVVSCFLYRPSWMTEKLNIGDVGGFFPMAYVFHIVRQFAVIFYGNPCLTKILPHLKLSQRRTFITG